MSINELSSRVGTCSFVRLRYRYIGFINIGSLPTLPFYLDNMFRIQHIINFRRRSGTALIESLSTAAQSAN